MTKRIFIKQKFKKLLYWFATAMFVFFIGTTVISYRIIVRNLGKVHYSERAQQRLQQARSYLLKEGAQEISFKTEDGISIAGYLIVRAHARRNLLLCHGYRGAKEFMSEHAALFPDDNILLIDFRAHGQSAGAYSSLGYNEKKDALVAVHFLQTNEATKNLPIFGIGVSMGGAVLLAAAHEKPVFKALVIDSAFADLNEHLTMSFEQRTGLPRVPFMSLSRFIFEYVTGSKVKTVSPRFYVQHLNIPLLFIHAQDDEEIPVADSYCLYEKAIGKKELWIVASCRHGTICRKNWHEYQERVNNFFNAVIS